MTEKVAIKPYEGLLAYRDIMALGAKLQRMADENNLMRDALGEVAFGTPASGEVYREIARGALATLNERANGKA